MGTSQRKAALSAGFLVCVVATGLIVWGATATWVSGDANGIHLEFGGQDNYLGEFVDIDPVWLFAAAGVSAFGLLIVLLTRARAAYALCIIGAIGTAVILIVDWQKLLGDAGDVKVSEIGWGAWMTAGAAIALLLGAIVGMRSIAADPGTPAERAPASYPPTQAYGTPPPPPAAGSPPPPPPPPTN